MFEHPVINHNKCGDCKHIERWACGSKFFHYCRKWLSKKTANGFRKVKCKDVGCLLFVEKKSAK